MNDAAACLTTMVQYTDSAHRWERAVLTFRDNQLSVRVMAGLLLVQAVFAATVVITGESFWIDELITAEMADVPSLSDWLEQFRTSTASDIQSPLYHFYMFIWTQLFGFSEYAMRMANWPLFMAAQAVLLWTFRRTPVFAISMIVLSTFHPLVWYYLNEARPYAMVYLGAVCTFAPVVSLFAPLYIGAGKVEPYSAWVFAFGVLTLAGSHMLGALWSGVAVLLVLGYHWRLEPAGWRRHRWPYVALALGLVALFCFFTYTLLRGARPVWFESTLGTLLFSAYELLGLSGLGPGRLDLRDHGAAALGPWLVPVGIGAVVLGYGVLYGLAVLICSVGRRSAALMLAAALAPVVVVAAVGFLMHFRALGRHFMPEGPILLGLLALSVTVLLGNGTRRSVLTAAAIIVTLITSGFSMNTERHAKDDYRYAAAVAKQALEVGETVWWGAWVPRERYYSVYGVPLRGADRESEGCPMLSARPQQAAIAVNSLRLECLQQMPYPDLVVLSKPDLFDARGALVGWLEHEHFNRVENRPAFSFWRSSGKSSG